MWVGRRSEVVRFEILPARASVGPVLRGQQFVRGSAEVHR